MYNNNMLQAMHLWAIANNLEHEFIEEILMNDHLGAWLLMDGLMKRFGYFVLEHCDQEEILYKLHES